MDATQSKEITTVTRRDVLTGGGALFVSLYCPSALATQPANGASLDPGSLGSWLEIRSDNTVLVRTGRTETGTGMSGYYPQVVAEELRVRPETVSLLMGDTDKTPDGGYSAGFLYGMTNVRKVAAYTYQALLKLAANRLGVAPSELTVLDGVVSGGGHRISYGSLVEGQHLDLRIPIGGQPANPAEGKWADVTSLDGLTVLGNPPMKPMSEFTVIGNSHPIPGIPDKVTGNTLWTCDVRLPGMLHARVVRPPTFGSTVITVGPLDKNSFPTAALVRKGNLIAVVSPNEWEAVVAAQSVAATTRWTEWSGLPRSENLSKALRERDWGPPLQSKGRSEDVVASLKEAAKTVSASYEQPYVRHAPIGPFNAIASVHVDGTTTVWTHSAHSQGMRARLAGILGVSIENVVVRWLDHAGQFGRTTLGGDGAEADAVILSQLTGRPVRVQWTLQEDLAWSSVSPAWVSNAEAALDASGHITAVRTAFYSPHPYDVRPVGALLAGIHGKAPSPTASIDTVWAYDRIPARFEAAYAMPNLGAQTPTAGLRGNIMRTPGQRQQNFVLESLIDEAAALAGADPIEFRIRHTRQDRLIQVLTATAQAAGWQRRPAPQAGARKQPTQGLRGRGVCAIIRQNAYWAGIAEVEVIPATGTIEVIRFSIGVDCGKVINPRQLKRCMQSGVIMGLSEALKEEVTFDTSKVTSTDWSRYRILTMAEVPEIRIVQLSRNDKGFGGGSEAANAVGPGAVAAAFFDATGVRARRIPLTPAYVTELLRQPGKEPLRGLSEAPQAAPLYCAL